MKKIMICLIILILISGCGYKDCGKDMDCFKKSFKICEKAVVSIDKEGISVTSRIRGLVPFDRCLVSLKVNEVKGEFAMEYPSEAQSAVGKTLNCDLDYHLDDYSLSTLTENYDRCSGPLKTIIQQKFKEEMEIVKEFNEILV